MRRHQEGSALAVPPRESQSVSPAPPAGDQPVARIGRWLPALSRLLTLSTVAASGLWGPVMLVVAAAIRPVQFDDITAYPHSLLLALAADARQRM
jgi:hypothetical protein